ncbi:MAG: DUF4065 domain-containing protein [Desulfuromonadales bacterium]|nr:DUF4065 domain-containing protein [Desulfuromonadales bacterium]
MATINDACDYIISKTAEDGLGLSVLKLQKLLYYSQAWYLAFDNGPLFDGKFQAWVHGPVSREIFDRFKDQKFLYSAVTQDDISPDFSFDKLTNDERIHIDKVLTVYGEFTGDQLEAITHQEAPWIAARAGLPHHMRCENDLDEDLMTSFYKDRLTS